MLQDDEQKLKEQGALWADVELWLHAYDFGELLIQYRPSNHLLRPGHDQTIMDRRGRNVVLSRKTQHGGNNNSTFAEHQVAPVPRHVGGGFGTPLAKQWVTSERLFANHADRVFLAINRPTILAVFLRELLLEARRPLLD